MTTLKLRRGDEVRVISGGSKAATGKVLKVHPKTHEVTIEGVGLTTRHMKAGMQNPRGRSVELHKPIHISNVALIHPTEKSKISRVGYKVDKDGTKSRVYRVNNKEIDS